MNNGAMKVVEITEAGNADVLKLTERPVPEPGHGRIVIRNAAAGVNRPDVLQRSGLYRPPPGASDLPGLESAGTIHAVGTGVDRWRVGDRVTALLPGGGYAEFSETSANHALPVPDGIGIKAAAALCETAFTVWSNVFMRGGLKAGEAFLVHGGSSGIGTMAIMLASTFGARVFATAGSEAKCRECEKLGADRAVNYREDDFVGVTRELTDGRGVDVILDMVGGDYIPRNIKALADDGRLVQIAFLQGPKVELNFAQLMTRRLTITGSTLRPQSEIAKARIASDLERNVWPLLASGRLAPVMDSEFPLREAAAAHRRMESSQHVGKIILTMN